MRRATIAAAALAIVALVLVASQLLIPGIAERKTTDRLTDRGGRAEVTVRAFPALRLLFGDGSRFEVEAEGLELDIERGAEDLDRLDGFDRVEIAIANSAAGPFALDSLSLTRRASSPYRLRTRGSASPADVVDYGADRFGIPGGSILGGLAGQALGRTPVPFRLDMRLESSDDGIRVLSGDTSIAGIPAGPIAELIVAAVLARL